MNGYIDKFQDDAVVLAYQRAVQNGETTLAKNIRANHSDLEHRFVNADKALATPATV